MIKYWKVIPFNNFKKNKVISIVFLFQAPKKWKLYINFCSWQRVPEPKTTEDPIPVTGTDLQKDKEGSGQNITFRR